MNKRTLIIAAVAFAVLAGGVLWRPLTVDQGESAWPSAATPPAVRPSPTVREAASGPIDAAPAASTGDEHERRLAFHDRVRTFFARAPAMSMEEKRAQAPALHAEIQEYEARRELSAAEALTLRLALIRETSAGPAQLEQMRELQQSYLARDAQRAPAADPMFDLYKVREQEIVAQVLAMNEFPDGLTREDYLRARLQREREILFGESGR